MLLGSNGSPSGKMPGGYIGSYLMGGILKGFWGNIGLLSGSIKPGP